MKRTALALAAAFLGTGCIVTDDHHDCAVRDVTVTWSGFTGPDAVSNRPCGSQVAYVDVFLDGQQVVGPLVHGHFACGDYGVNILDVTTGSYALTVEGLASDETILFRDERSFSASGCGSFGVATEPAAGYVDLQYAFYSGGTPLANVDQLCAGPNLWLSIFDPTANVQPILSDATFFPQEYACVDQYPTPISLRFTLPSGAYTLEWMEERGAANTYLLESADCADHAFTVPVTGAVPVPVHLDTTAAAPCGRPVHN